MKRDIVERRARRDRWTAAHAAAGAVRHGTPRVTADPADYPDAGDRRAIGVADAVAWGMADAAEATLHLCDEGEGL